MNDRFAEHAFRWAGICGIVVLLPLYFLEGTMGRLAPPPTNHPEQYCAFIGVALAWQFAFAYWRTRPQPHHDRSLG
jgi:hypothetical protein